MLGSSYTHPKTEKLSAHGAGENSWIAYVKIRDADLSTTVWATVTEGVESEAWEFGNVDGGDDRIEPSAGGDWPAGEDATVELWQEDPIDMGRAFKTSTDFAFSNCCTRACSNRI